MDFTNLNITKDISKRIEEAILKEIRSTLDVKSETATTTSNTLTEESINKLIKELEKRKIEFKATRYTDINSMFVVDHEEIRKDVPYHNERGKTVFYNPNNELLVEELKKRRFIK